jgi:hypothetical protein
LEGKITVVHIKKFLWIDLLSFSIGFNLHIRLCEFFVDLKLQLFNVLCEVFEVDSQTSFGKFLQCFVSILFVVFVVMKTAEFLYKFLGHWLLILTLSWFEIRIFGDYFGL